MVIICLNMHFFNHHTHKFRYRSHIVCKVINNRTIFTHSVPLLWIVNDECCRLLCHHHYVFFDTVAVNELRRWVVSWVTPTCHSLPYMTKMHSVRCSPTSRFTTILILTLLPIIIIEVQMCIFRHLQMQIIRLTLITMRAILLLVVRCTKCACLMKLMYVRRFCDPMHSEPWVSSSPLMHKCTWRDLPRHINVCLVPFQPRTCWCLPKGIPLGMCKVHTLDDPVLVFSCAPRFIWLSEPFHCCYELPTLTGMYYNSVTHRLLPTWLTCHLIVVHRLQIKRRGDWNEWRGRRITITPAIPK